MQDGDKSAHSTVCLVERGLTRSDVPALRGDSSAQDATGDFRSKHLPPLHVYTATGLQRAAFVECDRLSVSAISCVSMSCTLVG